MSFTDQPQPTGGEPWGGAAGGATPPFSPGQGQPPEPAQVEHPEVVTSEGQPGEPGDQPSEAVEQPAKVMRIGSMIKLLLEEVRAEGDLDEPSRDRLREIYETSV